MRVTSPQRTILCVHTKREGAKGFHTKQRFHLQRDTFARHGRARSRGYQVDLQHATFAQVEIFKLCHDIRVMTANQRSTAWPLSDVRNVTANQFSTGQPFPAVHSGVNRRMEEKVIVAVCDSPSSIENSI